MVFGLLMMLLILIVGGIAVDTMRFETQRTRLQATADSAVLAAASLSQVRDAREVVEDYFDKAGLLHLLGDVEVDEGLNFKNVRVTASTTVPTFFMRLVGINSLNLNTLGAAEERINNVEVSLVLDLSGSMNQYNRIENLQAAAEDFIDTLLGATSDGQISISIIPYTGHVNAGPHILSQYNVTHDQGYSHCIDFDDADFTTTAMPVTQTLMGAGHGFPWEHTTYYNRNNPAPPFYDCPIAPGNAGLEIMPLQSNPQVLKDRINAMEALGATSIDIGLKWGAAMLDPSFRPVVAGLVDLEQVAPEFSNRPFDFDEPDTLKVVVLMTDGENFEERRIIDSMKSGASNVWINPDDTSTGTYSLYNPSNGRYWWSSNNSWQDYPYGNSPEQSCTTETVCTRWNWRGNCTQTSQEQTCTVTGYSGPARQLDYPELWHRASMYWVGRNIYAAAEGYAHNQSANRARQWLFSWTTSTAPSVKDQRLRDMCDAVKSTGMIIFSVAFEADPGGIRELRDCATSNAHFFDVDGLEVRTAFRSIAVQISQLRLTQ